MTFRIEEIIEDLMDDGLPQHLAGKVEELIVNEHAAAMTWKEKYEEARNIASWTSNPDRMGR